MAAVDDFPRSQGTLTSPARSSFAITPHDTNEFAHITREIYVGGAGDIWIECLC